MEFNFFDDTQKIDSGHINFLGKSIVPSQDDINNWTQRSPRRLEQSIL
jgi:hypothetical protein